MLLLYMYNCVFCCCARHTFIVISTIFRERCCIIRSSQAYLDNIMRGEKFKSRRTIDSTVSVPSDGIWTQFCAKLSPRLDKLAEVRQTFMLDSFVTDFKKIVS